MITRRQIRIKVMQAVYAWYLIDLPTEEVYDLNLKDTGDQIRSLEKKNGDAGDFRLLRTLFFKSIERRSEFDQLIQSKAENWELERIALLDRILMQLGICEMLEFPEIPIKVTINEYLEIAKKYSTPKSSKFINGILDSLYANFKEEGLIQKSGRGLIETSLPRKGGTKPPQKRKRKRKPMNRPMDGPPRGEGEPRRTPRPRRGEGPPREPRPRRDDRSNREVPPHRLRRDQPPGEENPGGNDQPQNLPEQPSDNPSDENN